MLWFTDGIITGHFWCYLTSLMHLMVMWWVVTLINQLRNISNCSNCSATHCSLIKWSYPWIKCPGLHLNTSSFNLWSINCTSSWSGSCRAWWLMRLNYRHIYGRWEAPNGHVRKTAYTSIVCVWHDLWDHLSAPPRTGIINWTREQSQLDEERVALSASLWWTATFFIGWASVGGAFLIQNGVSVWVRMTTGHFSTLGSGPHVGSPGIPSNWLKEYIHFWHKFPLVWIYKFQ